jgi:hypothetical protein
VRNARTTYGSVQVESGCGDDDVTVALIEDTAAAAGGGVGAEAAAGERQRAGLYPDATAAYTAAGGVIAEGAFRNGECAVAAVGEGTAAIITRVAVEKAASLSCAVGHSHYRISQ